jgi:hypothetical protein
MPFAQVGHSIPLNNINGSLVNVDNSHYSGSAFSNRVLPQTVNPQVLPEPWNNRQAADSFIPGCTSGGKKKKFKNISNMYKMSKTKKHRTFSKLKRKYSYKYKSKSKRSKRMKNKRSKSKRYKSKKSYKGGYSQYQSNVPMTQTYSLGGHLNANQSALANPAPYHVLSNCTNCVDNYNHFMNKGFPSFGSY